MDNTALPPNVRDQENLLTAQRDTLAAQIAAELNAAAFNGQSVDASTAHAQISSANNLIENMHNLAVNS